MARIHILGGQTPILIGMFACLFGPTLKASGGASSAGRIPQTPPARHKAASAIEPSALPSGLFLPQENLSVRDWQWNFQRDASKETFAQGKAQLPSSSGGSSGAAAQPTDVPIEHKPKPAGTDNSPGHIFWVVPAYKVDYGKTFTPLTPREKFNEMAESDYDPLGLFAGAVEAVAEYSHKDGFCGYGVGLGGYAKCYGSAELDSDLSAFIGDYGLTVLLHQDPRYFRLGQGSFGKRTWYALTRVFVTHSDSGRTIFYSSALSGTLIAGAASNLYYPHQDRGFSLTMSRIAVDLGDTFLYNAAAEFWPDFKRKLPHFMR